jgi:cytidine deaminase
MDEPEQGNPLEPPVQNYSLNYRHADISAAMKKQTYQFSFEVFDSIDALSEQDARLLQQAREVTAEAYAPYSHFSVGAVARLANGEVLSGTNQENASFPAGLCAERVLLSNISARYPGVAIETIALSYDTSPGVSDHPISPCGICRQTLQEYEIRLGAPIRLIMGGQTGKVYIIPQAGFLLPLSFTGEELGRSHGKKS